MRIATTRVVARLRHGSERLHVAAPAIWFCVLVVLASCDNGSARSATTEPNWNDPAVTERLLTACNDTIERYLSIRTDSGGWATGAPSTVPADYRFVFGDAQGLVDASQEGTLVQCDFTANGGIEPSPAPIIVVRATGETVVVAVPP